MQPAGAGGKVTPYYYLLLMTPSHREAINKGGILTGAAFFLERMARSIRIGGVMTAKTKTEEPRPKSSVCRNMRHIWRGMIDRCQNPDSLNYHNYGGRGIEVCDRWIESPENFAEDMGQRPSPKHSIDRIDNDGNYTPENCRWATMKEQCMNLRKTKWVPLGGNLVPLPLAAEAVGLKQNTIVVRLRRGWTPEEAVSGLRRIRKPTTA